MPLSPAQMTTLLADIAANTATVVVGGVTVQINQIGAAGKPPKGTDSAAEVAAWYNTAASPSWTAWRKLVALAEIAGAINGTELAGLSSLNNTRLQTIITLISAAGGLNASLADQRQFFDDIFSGSGGTTTRAQLLALWKRLATRLQKLFSSGTGSDASPATTGAGVGDTFSVAADEIRVAWGV